VQEALSSKLHQSFPPPGVPHWRFNGKSTMLSLGDRISICERGCISILRHGKPLQFQDQNGVVTDAFEFSSVFNAVTAEQQVVLMCSVIGLKPVRVPNSTDSTTITFEAIW